MSPLLVTADSGSNGAPRLFKTGRILLVAALMAAPLPYASVQTWAWASLALLAVLVLFVWGIACVRQGAARIFWSPIYLPAGLFLFWAFIQFAGHFTLDYVGTREAVVKLATDYTFFFLAGQLWAMSSEKERGALGPAVTIYAFLIAFIAIVQYFSGSNYNYWNYWSMNSIWGAFGTYVNRNHYAGLMEMLIPLAATYALSRPEEHPQRTLLGFAVLVPIASLLLSGSRGGFISLLVEIIILGGVLLRISLVSGRRDLLAIGALGITGAAILFFWIDPGQVSNRLEKVFEFKSATDLSYNDRATATLDSLRIFSDHPLAGIGVGSFEAAFPRYQSLPGDAIWNHAHNDYAEALAETGLIGGSLILWAVVIFFGCTFRIMRGPLDHEGDWIRLGATLACIGLGVHSLFDFNLHIPANALWFAVCAAITQGTIISRGQKRFAPAIRTN